MLPFHAGHVDPNSVFLAASRNMSDVGITEYLGESLVLRALGVHADRFEESAASFSTYSSVLCLRERHTTKDVTFFPQVSTIRNINTESPWRVQSCTFH